MLLSCLNKRYRQGKEGGRGGANIFAGNKYSGKFGTQGGCHHRAKHFVFQTTFITSQTPPSQLLNKTSRAISYSLCLHTAYMALGCLAYTNFRRLFIVAPPLDRVTHTLAVILLCLPIALWTGQGRVRFAQGCGKRPAPNSISDLPLRCYNPSAVCRAYLNCHIVVHCHTADATIPRTSSATNQRQAFQ